MDKESMEAKYKAFLKFSEWLGEPVEEYKTFDWFCNKYNKDNNKGVK